MVRNRLRTRRAKLVQQERSRSAPDDKEPNGNRETTHNPKQDYKIKLESNISPKIVVAVRAIRFGSAATHYLPG